MERVQFRDWLEQASSRTFGGEGIWNGGGEEVEECLTYAERGIEKMTIHPSCCLFLNSRSMRWIR